MATKYLFSGAAGAGTGADWTNAYTTLAAAIAGIVAGDTIKVHKTHSETNGAATTYTFPGTAAAPNLLLCVDKDASDAVATGAFIGAAATFNIIVNGHVVLDGVNWSPGGGMAGTGANVVQFAGTTNNRVRVRNSVIALPNSTGAKINGGGPGAFVDFENVSIANGGINAFFPAGAIIRNSTPYGQATVLGTGAAQSGLINGSLNSGVATLTFDGCDLSALGSGKTLVVGASTVSTFLILTNCKISSAVTVGSFANSGASEVILMNCNDTAGALRHERHNYRGKQEIATGVYRTGGGTDGSTSHSHKITTTANTKPFLPFESLEIEFAVPTAKIGVSTTVTLHTLTDGVTLTNAQVWAVANVLNVSGSRAASAITNGLVDLTAAGANLTDDSATGWTAGGITTPVKQKITLTFTPQAAGMHKVRIAAGLASSVVYVCPKPDIA